MAGGRRARERAQYDMPVFEYDQLRFHYGDRGAGTPFVFQHGLGGDIGQPQSLFAPPTGFRLLGFDCRGHGKTRPLGDPEKFNIAAFADDLAAFLDHLRLERTVVGGISMGAAVALNFALRHADRVMGLVLSRPAWLAEPNAANARLYGTIARLIREHGGAAGFDIYQESEEYRELRAASPDAANSLRGQFMHPRAAEAVVRLERIPRDAPNRDPRDWARIGKPTLVLANRQDPLHPFAFGEILAAAIPAATLRELTPKSVSAERHAADVQRFVGAFLEQHFAPRRGGKDRAEKNHGREMPTC